MTKEELLKSLDFFYSLKIEVNDITTDQQRNDNSKVVQVLYHFNSKVFKSQPLFYKEVTGLSDVRDIDELHQYFNGPVYWLDIDKHQWPKPSGESDLNSLVINDIAAPGDDEFKNFLKTLANNDQKGYIQLITKEGRPAQYYHNLENNNHWHDLVLLIQAVIKSKGKGIDKSFFKHLVFNWNSGKRVSLAFDNNGNDFKIIRDLYKNIRSIQPIMDLRKIRSLLEYKKQIILQGPPGTGKTKLAKEIASELIIPATVAEADIKNRLSVGLKIHSADNYTEYTIKAIGDANVTVVLKNTLSEYKPSYKEIIKAYEIKMWEGKQIGGNDPYAAAIAKYIYKNPSPEQYKIIQFHPSYTYEDFVRGIVTDSKGDKVEYKNVNKILGKLATEAKKNWDDYHKDGSNVSKEKRVQEYFELFVDELNDKITAGQPIQLTPSVNLIDVEDDAFRYKGNDGWSALGNRMLFKDIIQAFLDENRVRQDIKKNKNLSGLAIQHASYFIRVLNMFQDYLDQNNLKFDNLSDDKPVLKNYVLIIDEINRANLSSVLGELIYALEYRGEDVESMYEVDGSNKLFLTDNLLIIGTMNTADRSVGHIDYAIRRRFAFVDVPPKDLSIELGDKFNKQLFDKVGSLFSYDTHLSNEFEPKDVRLGHSYFIDKSKDGGSIDIRLKHEIIPILEEYIKDGVLKDSDALRKAIAELVN